MAHFGLGRAVDDYAKMVVPDIYVIYAKDKTPVAYWVTDEWSWTGKTLRFDSSGFICMSTSIVIFCVPWDITIIRNPNQLFERRFPFLYPIIPMINGEHLLTDLIVHFSTLLHHLGLLFDTCIYIAGVWISFHRRGNQKISLLGPWLRCCSAHGTILLCSCLCLRFLWSLPSTVAFLGGLACETEPISCQAIIRPALEESWRKWSYLLV